MFLSLLIFNTLAYNDESNLNEGEINHVRDTGQRVTLNSIPKHLKRKRTGKKENIAQSSLYNHPTPSFSHPSLPHNVSSCSTRPKTRTDPNYSAIEASNSLHLSGGSLDMISQPSTSFAQPPLLKTHPYPSGGSLDMSSQRIPSRRVQSQPPYSDMPFASLLEEDNPTGKSYTGHSSNYHPQTPASDATQPPRNSNSNSRMYFHYDPKPGSILLEDTPYKNDPSQAAYQQVPYNNKRVYLNLDEMRRGGTYVIYKNGCYMKLPCLIQKESVDSNNSDNSGKKA